MPPRRRLITELMRLSVGCDQRDICKDGIFSIDKKVNAGTCGMMP